MAACRFTLQTVPHSRIMMFFASYQLQEKTMRNSFFRGITSSLVSLILITGCLSTCAAATATDDVTVGTGEIVYRARAGDTLIAIAARFTSSPNNWAAIGRLNRIDKDTRIAVDTVIHIPADLLTDQPVDARIVALSGIATATSADKIPTRLQAGSRVVEGMEIKTSANSFVTLALPDSSRISIPSNSLIRLTTLRTARYTHSPRTAITILHGAVESVVSPLQENKGSYRILSPAAIAGVRGTHFLVAVLPNGSTANALFEGVIELERPASAQHMTLQHGYGSVIGKGGIGAPTVLLAAPNLRALPEPRDTPEVRFNLTPEAGATAYHLQLANDIEAQHPFIETRSAAPLITLANVADGDYSVRISAIDAQGIEGFSRVIPVSLRRNVVPASSTDAPSAPWLGGTDQQQLTLQWRSTAAAEFIVQIARDSAFSWLLLNSTSAVPAISLPRPPFGTYYARVQRKNRDGSFSNFSAVQAFVVTDQWIIPEGLPQPSATSSAR